MYPNLKKSLCLAACILSMGGLAPAQAYVAFWDFNSGDFRPAPGSQGSMSTASTDLTLLSQEEFTDDGTEIGAPPGVEGGAALSYIDIGTFYAKHEITISDLNFTGISNVSLSFAFQLTDILDFTGASIQISYDLNDGSGFRTLATDMLARNYDWTPFAYSFGSLLDNAPSAKLRITTRAAFTLASDLQFDNVQVVPEGNPALYLLLGLGLVAGLRLFRRQATA